MLPDIRDRRWQIAALLGVGVLVNYIDGVNISVSYDALHADFGISTVAFGYLLGAFNWTTLYHSFPLVCCWTGSGLNRSERFAPYCEPCQFWCGLVARGRQFLHDASLVGFGRNPTFPANAKAIDQWFARNQRGLPTAIFDAAAKLGPAIGVPLVGIPVDSLWMALEFRGFGRTQLLVLCGICSVLYGRAFRKPDGDSRRRGTCKRALEVPTEAAEGYRAGDGFFGYNYCFYLLLLWLPTYFFNDEAGCIAFGLLYRRSMAPLDPDGSIHWRLSGGLSHPPRV